MRNFAPLGSPSHPRSGSWIEGTGDLAGVWFAYSPRTGHVVYAAPYWDRRHRLRWHMQPHPMAAGDASACDEARQRHQWPQAADLRNATTRHAHGATT